MDTHPHTCAEINAHNAENGSSLNTCCPTDKLLVSLFPSLDEPRGEQYEATWDELCDFMSHSETRSEKGGQLFSLAIYDQKNVYRNDKSVQAIGGLVADCDESHTIYEVRSIAKALGVKVIIYSSHHHGTPDQEKHPNAHAPGERYRAVFIFDEPIPVELWDETWERFNMLFGGEIDQACKNPSRGYYLPSHPTGGSPFFEVFGGRCITPNDLPPLPDGFYAPTYVHPTGESQNRPGDDFNEKATNEVVAEIMMPFGWRVVSSNSNLLKLRRPGKIGPGISATIGYYGPGILHVFSSNTDHFEEGRAYKPFTVLALLQHDGDFKAATRAVVKQGFGTEERFGGFEGFSKTEEENQIAESETENEGFGGFESQSGAESGPNFQGEPQPLAALLSPVMPFDEKLLPEPLREWVTDASERICCPPDFIAVPLVISLGSIIGRTIQVRPKKFDDWRVVPNLWGAIVGRPGTKKTPASSEALRHLERLQGEAIEKYNKATADNDLKNEVNEVQRIAIRKRLATAASKKATREELEAIRRELDDVEDNTATLRRYLVNDTTVEALGEILKDNPQGVLQNRDELMGWLNSLEKNGRETDRAFYLEAFNGTKEKFISDRIGRGRTVIPNVCVSVFGTVQPGPLTQMIRGASEEKKQRDGFISRFQLMVYPDSMPYKRVDRRPDTEAKDRAFYVFKVLNSFTPEKLGAQSEQGEIPYLRFCREAQELFDGWLDGLEVRLASGKESTILEEHFSKYRSLMPSLALIFHLVDVAGGAALTGPISVSATSQAIAWCQYLETHARRIYGQAYNAETEVMERLGERLNELPNPFTVRDVTHKGWAGLTNKEEVERLLMLLQESLWVQGQQIATNPKKGGRPTTKFWVNPSLRKEEKEGEK